MTLGVSDPSISDEIFASLVSLAGSARLPLTICLLLVDSCLLLSEISSKSSLSSSLKRANRFALACISLRIACVKYPYQLQYIAIAITRTNAKEKRITVQYHHP